MNTLRTTLLELLTMSNLNVRLIPSSQQPPMNLSLTLRSALSLTVLLILTLWPPRSITKASTYGGRCRTSPPSSRLGRTSLRSLTRCTRRTSRTSCMLIS